MALSATWCILFLALCGITQISSQYAPLPYPIPQYGMPYPGLAPPMPGYGPPIPPNPYQNPYGAPPPNPFGMYPQQNYANVNPFGPLFQGYPFANNQYRQQYYPQVDYAEDVAPDGNATTGNGTSGSVARKTTEVIVEEYDASGKLLRVQRVDASNATGNQFAYKREFAGYPEYPYAQRRAAPETVTRRTFHQQKPKLTHKESFNTKNSTTTIVASTILRPNEKPKTIVNIYRDASQPEGNTTIVDPEGQVLNVDTVVRSNNVLNRDSDEDDDSEE